MSRTFKIVIILTSLFILLVVVWKLTRSKPVEEIPVNTTLVKVEQLDSLNAINIEAQEIKYVNDKDTPQKTITNLKNKLNKTRDELESINFNTISLDSLESEYNNYKAYSKDSI